MITARDRITAALRHHTLDRIPICETGIWPETVARWETEGLPRGTDPVDYFQLDRVTMDHRIDAGFFPHSIFEETDDYVVDLNPYGTTVKYRKNAGSSGGHAELDHSVKTIDDWRLARRRLTVTQERIRPPAKVYDGEFRALTPVDHFWMSFCMCGMENLCCWLLESPQEMREIYDDYLDFLIGMLDLCAAEGPEFDAVWFFTDMAYHSGPMFSPQVFRRVVAPGYERLKAWCMDHDKWMLLHCDGNLDLLLPELIRVGFDWIHPLEARAGNDVRKLKERYGDNITFVGNINADILARGDRNEIEEEIASKITIAKKGGGYVYHIDHSVPPTVSFETYSFAVESIRKYGSYT